MTTPDPYSLRLLPHSGPAPRGLDGKSEAPERTPFASWEPWEWDEPVRVPEFTDRPSEGQEWGVLIGMWCLGLCAGLMVLGVVWQMVVGR